MKEYPIDKIISHYKNIDGYITKCYNKIVFNETMDNEKIISKLNFHLKLLYKSLIKIISVTGDFDNVNKDNTIVKSNLYIISESFTQLAIMCKRMDMAVEISARRIFENKNHLRNSCWIYSGVFGQITEVQAKAERIINSEPDDKDTIEDAWIDLYNYCKFGIVLIDYNIIFPKYINEEYK